MLDPYKVFRALSDPTRFKIVQLLMERHHCSVSLAVTLGISEAAVSQHMGVLKECGLVRGWRCKKRIHYELVPETLEGVVVELQGWLRKSPEALDCHTEGAPCSVVSERLNCKLMRKDGSE